jgi:hypothetical protein
MITQHQNEFNRLLKLFILFINWVIKNRFEFSGNVFLMYPYIKKNEKVAH